MERLTYRPSEPYASDATGDYVAAYSDYDISAIINRLADYEDTGLTPEPVYFAKSIIDSAFSDDTSKAERLRELAEADRDEHVVILPCKVGDVMYELYSTYSACTPYGEVYDDIGCAGCEATCDSCRVRRIRVIQPNTLPEVARYVGKVGKTVFLTREEAEKALEVTNNGA